MVAMDTTFEQIDSRQESLTLHHTYHGGVPWMLLWPVTNGHEITSNDPVLSVSLIKICSEIGKVGRVGRERRGGKQMNLLTAVTNIQ
jgi:hypothetical protein